MQIIKRDGHLEDFDSNKIKIAIKKAYNETQQKYDEDILNNIVNQVEQKCYKLITVEEIQNLVETILMDVNPVAAKVYIRYRYKREVAREYTNDFFDEIGRKLSGKYTVNQNANVDEQSFGGRIGEATSYLMKKYALDFIVSPMAKKNHLENMIYMHDLDHYPVGDHNCLSIPFDDLLANGFVTRQTDVRPANSISTAFQLLAVIFQLQSLQQFGGTSATHLDWTMVPYVRKSFFKHFNDGLTYISKIPVLSDIQNEGGITNVSINNEIYRQHTDAYTYALNMTKKEVEQAVEGMYHNLNTLQSRSGNQLPFTSINYGTCTSPEGRMVTRAILEKSIEGLGKLHKTPIFPCGIFQLGQGINRRPEDPNYDLFLLALESTAKRLYPNYTNIDWTGNAGYDKNDPKTYMSTMGCRTVNGFDINGLGQQKDGRGNICPVTIILPTLAMMAIEEGQGKSEDEIIDIFFNILTQKIEEAKDMLIERFDYICAQSPSSAKFMYENHTMAGYIPEEGIKSALKHGTLVIGQLALAETLELLIHTNQTTKEGLDLGIRIETLFNQKCKEYKEKYKLNFGVYYTPAENLCYTAMNQFKKKYGIIPHVSDKDYFTNSTHVPVWVKISPFEKIDIEAKLAKFSNAGCITYVELDGGMEHNIKALETLVNYAMDNDIPYLAINVPNDKCLNCGFEGEFNDSCPQCGSTNIQQLRRVTGYLTGDYKTAFNYGKQKETEDRIRHSEIVLH